MSAADDARADVVTLRAENAALREENDEFKRIRALLCKALVHASEATETEVRDAPMGCAVAQRRRVDQLRAHVAEAQQWARRLRQMAHPVDEEDGETVVTFDTLPWVQDAPPERTAAR